MEEKIARIKELLDEIIEEEQDFEEDFRESFELFELPEIVISIVDHLQPLLHPYEAAIYWEMFRRSILESGDVYTRASKRGLTSVVESSSGQSKELSYGSVKRAIAGLEEKGVIKQDGEPNREGTLYRIFLPEEIEMCQKKMKQEQEKELQEVDPKEEKDFYNIKENREKIFERDEYKCTYCGKQLTRFTATLDHVEPVSEGGDNSYENLTTACLQCNSKRGSRPVQEMLSEKDK